MIYIGHSLNIMIKREGKYKMILLLIVAVVIAVFSYMAVWLGDDINYAYSWVDQSLVSSIRDSIASQNVHYFVSNGRYVAHVIVQCFCGFLGHGWFAVANGLAYVLFMVLLCKITGITKSDDKNILMLTLTVLLSFQTKMVPSCQVGYIWMFSLSLLWLKYFFSDSKYNVWQSALLIILSLLAGNSQEAISVGISGALFFYWVENRKRMSVAQYVMMIGYWIGALSNCLAPGTIDRGTSGSLSLAAHLILCLNFFVYARATYITCHIYIVGSRIISTHHKERPID